MEATDSKIQTLQIVYDQQDSSTPASGVIANIGEEAASGIVLLKNQWAELKFIEIETPLDTSGVAENIEHIKPVIDGSKFRGGNKIILRADNDSLIPAPRVTFAQNIELGDHGSRRPWSLGLTLPELLKHNINANPGLIMRNTTIKTKEGGTIDMESEIGNAALTDNMRVRIYAVKYLDAKVLEFFMKAIYGRARRVGLKDFKSGRDFSFTVAAKSFDANDFDKLIGGNEQDLQSGIEIDLLDFWARNALATTVNTDYALSSDDNTQVDRRERNMDFDLKEDELVVVTNLGLRPHANHQDLRIDVNDKIMFTDTIQDGMNNLDFGRITAPSAGAEPSDHEYRGVPSIEPVFISGEQGKVIIKDTGTAIADGTNHGAGDLVVLRGWKIKNKGFKGNKPSIWKGSGSEE